MIVTLAALFSLQVLPSGQAVAGSLLDATSPEAADLDGDGLADLVCSSSEDGLIAWFRNRGGGEFEAGRKIARYSSEIEDLAAADFDGDGDIDVVSAERQRHRVSLHRNTGAGEFLSTGIYDVLGSNPRALGAGDIDGDGYVDLAVGVNGSTSVGWLRNLGGAGFGPLVDIAALEGLARDVTGLKVADFDGDGDGDVVAVLSGGTGAYLMENLGSGFDSPVQLRFGGLVAQYPSIATDDIDGDGDVDIAHPELGWFRNDGGAALAFTSMGRPWGAASRSVTLEDLDGDGDQDFVWASAGDVRWTESVQSGTPQGGVLVSTGGSYVNEVTFASLGGGLKGLVMAASEKGTLLLAPLQSQGTFGPLTRVASSFSTSGRATAWADVNRDGVSDAIMHVRGTQSLVVYEGSPDGTFQEGQSFGPGGTGFGAWYDFSVADFNGDGWDDLVATTDSTSSHRWLIRFRNNGGSFGFGTYLSVPISDFRKPYAADMNSDGHPDLILLSNLSSGGRVSWWENNGSGGFGAVEEMGVVGRYPTLMDVDDVNGDGVPDVLVATLFESSVAILSSPAGGFQAPIVLGSGTRALLKFYDYDADGDKDILTIDRSSSSGPGGLVVHENTGAGFAVTPTVLASGVGDAVNATLVDMDGDGDRDLAIQGDAYSASAQTAPRTVMENIGGGQFADPVSLSLLTPIYGRLSAYDVDRDGDEDLVTYDRADGLVWFANVAELGQQTCSGVVNSTGGGGVLSARGYTEATANDLNLGASGLPTGSTTMFLASQSTGLATGPGGSQGNLCLGGSIGRFLGPGELQVTDAAGSARLLVDLTQIPGPTGFQQAVAGETWNFQAWYRDANPLPTSNFTSALQVSLR